jgi:hypothetical protein
MASQEGLFSIEVGLGKWGGVFIITVCRDKCEVAVQQIHIFKIDLCSQWNFVTYLLLLLLSLAPQPSLGIGLLHKIRLNFVEASQFFTG